MFFGFSIIDIKEGTGPGGVWKTKLQWKYYWMKDWELKQVMLINCIEICMCTKWTYLLLIVFFFTFPSKKIMSKFNYCRMLFK